MRCVPALKVARRIESCRIGRRGGPCNLGVVGLATCTIAHGGIVPSIVRVVVG